MKFPVFLFLFLACGVAMLSAQTNTATNGMESVATLSAQTNSATNGVESVAMLSAQTNAATNGVESILALVTTNKPAAPPATNETDAANHAPTTIASTGPLIFDMNNHWATYSDHVRVTQGQMKLTCEWLKANFPANGNEISDPTNIVAETNVVVDYVDSKGQKGRAVGDKAVYEFQVQNGATNETITLTGNPPEILEGPNYTNRTTATSIVYDMVTRRVMLYGPSGTYWSTNKPSGSNSTASGDLPFPK